MTQFNIPEPPKELIALLVRYHNDQSPDDESAEDITQLAIDKWRELTSDKVERIVYNEQVDIITIFAQSFFSKPLYQIHAANLHDRFSALIKAGFSEDQAMQLLLKYGTNIPEDLNESGD